ncbi:MAG: azurin [Bacteroidota bacterium]
MILALAFVFFQCGGSSNSTASQQETTPAAEASSESSSESSPADEVTLVLNTGDLLEYDKTELRVKAGQQVTLTLNHSGQMAKEAMGHNFVLLKPGTDIPTFANEALDARENEYIPAGSEQVIVHTKLIGGGESDTITFEAPSPGTYDYICSFPGHYALMQGKLIVE